jgi:hypothetical protein
MFDEPSCESLNGAGFPCGMRPLTGERWCWSHSPDQREAAHDARKRGGQRSRGADTTPVPDLDVFTPGGRMELVQTVIHFTMQQANTAARSRALAALVRLASDMDQQQEEAEIQEQIAALTHMVQERERERGY